MDTQKANNAADGSAPLAVVLDSTDAGTLTRAQNLLAVLVPVALAVAFMFGLADSKVEAHGERPHVGAVPEDQYQRDRARLLLQLDRIESKLDDRLKK